MNATLSSLLSVVGLVGSMVISTDAFAVERPTAYTTRAGAVANPTRAYDTNVTNYAIVNTARSCNGALQPASSEIIEFYGFSGAATTNLAVDHTLSITLNAIWGSTGAAPSNGLIDIGLDYSVDGGNTWIPIRGYLGTDGMDPATETLPIVIAGGTLEDLARIPHKPSFPKEFWATRTRTPPRRLGGVVGSLEAARSNGRKIAFARS